MLRKSRKLSVLLGAVVVITIMLLVVLNKVSQAAIVEETMSAGQNEQIFEIYTVDDYLEFANSLAETGEYFDYTVILCADLDFFGYKNVPMIGGDSVKFYGVFDGNGHQISNLRMNHPNRNAGLFAKLAGVVKNLVVTDCEFSGETVGTIAAECYDAKIVNCYIDAETDGVVSGVIVGNLNGNIYNCVANSENYAGNADKGNIEYTYVKGSQDRDTLNYNLSWLSGEIHSSGLLAWGDLEKNIFLETSPDLLQKLDAKLEVSGKELKLEAYYSEIDRSWCIALPSSYCEEKLTLEAVTSRGNTERFYRHQAELEMIFTWEDRHYLIKFLNSDGLESFYVTLANDKTLRDVQENKRFENRGLLTIIHADGTIGHESIEIFCGRGNDSWSAQKKGYKLKLTEPTDLLGMGESENFALLAGYRNNSLLSYITTTELIKELEFPYAPEFRLVNLYVAGEYVGVYFLAEKIEFGKNRIELSSVYEEMEHMNQNNLAQFELTQWKDDKTPAEKYYYNVRNVPEDITGNYLLELDVVDYTPEESRFVTTRAVPVIMKRAMYSAKEQVNYMADFWQEFEDALFDDHGYNQKGKHFTEYIDLESFAMQWLTYELVQENSMSSSIYYYKESDVTGDGKIHACFPWDMEHSYVSIEKKDILWNVTEQKKTLCGYWKAFYDHKEFRQELHRIWYEKFVPAIDTITYEEAFISDKGVKNLSWYKENMVIVDRLENSRWKKMYPLEKCQANKEFLKARKDVLSEILGNTGK